MDANIQSMVLGLISALGGGLGAGYIAKLFLSNYIKSNDDKHNETKLDLRGISDKVGEVKTDIAVINTKLDRINGVGDRVIVLEQAINKCSRDITAAHEKLRSKSG